MVHAATPYEPMAEPVRQDANFLARLFDLSFSTFVTPMIIRALYLIGLIAAFAVGVIAVVVALFDEGIWAFIWAAIFAPVWFIVVAVILRVWLEIAIAIFRIAQASMATAQNTNVQS